MRNQARIITGKNSRRKQGEGQDYSRMNLPRPTVEDIILTDQKQAQFDSEIKSKKLNAQNKRAIIKKYFNGVCTICARIPDKIVKYDVGDKARLVERYCNSCFKRWAEEKV